MRDFNCRRSQLLGKEWGSARVATNLPSETASKSMQQQIYMSKSIDVTVYSSVCSLRRRKLSTLVKIDSVLSLSITSKDLGNICFKNITHGYLSAFLSQVTTS